MYMVLNIKDSCSKIEYNPKMFILTIVYEIDYFSQIYIFLT